MLAEFAPRLVLVSFAAAPPHLAPEVRDVDSTRPIEILLFAVLLLALLAGLALLVEVTFLVH
jgi:hypothetical protein